jgi:prevent-host-death family protein
MAGKSGSEFLMSIVGVFDAKNRLTALIDEVERRGDEVVITRRGKPVARLVSVEGGFNRARAEEAARRLLAASKGKTLGGLSLKALIEEGRR